MDITELNLKDFNISDIHRIYESDVNIENMKLYIENSKGHSMKLSTSLVKYYISSSDCIFGKYNLLVSDGDIQYTVVKNVQWNDTLDYIRAFEGILQFAKNKSQEVLHIGLTYFKYLKK